MAKDLDEDEFGPNVAFREYSFLNSSAVREAQGAEAPCGILAATSDACLSGWGWLAGITEAQYRLASAAADMLGVLI